MNNLNVLIVGMTGAGKTSLARHFLWVTPRAFVFDPMDDYTDGAIFYTFREAVDFYSEVMRGDFHLIYRGDRETYPAWLDILWQSQGELDLPPLGVILEESSWYSTSHAIPPELDTIYTKGRRHRISVLTVTQRDTQINPIIRANSQVWVTMRQKKFSTDVKDVFTPAEQDQILGLETFTPFVGEPVEGKHYMVDLPDFLVLDRWIAVTQGGNDDSYGARKISDSGA